MKFIPSTNGGLAVLELTERNLRVLLAELNDPDSQRMLCSPDRQIMVRAVEDKEHYSDRPPGTMRHKPLQD